MVGGLRTSAASSPRALTGSVCPRILWGHGMASAAVSVYARHRTATGVLLGCDGFEVFRVDAVPDTTEMVEVKSIGDYPDVVFVEHTVRSYRPPHHLHRAVALSGLAALVQPAPTIADGVVSEDARELAPRSGGAPASLGANRRLGGARRMSSRAQEQDTAGAADMSLRNTGVSHGGSISERDLYRTVTRQA